VVSDICSRINFESCKIAKNALGKNYYSLSGTQLQPIEEMTNRSPNFETRRLKCFIENPKTLGHNHYLLKGHFRRTGVSQ
jgi:hypothetical protein